MLIHTMKEEIHSEYQKYYGAVSDRQQVEDMHNIFSIQIYNYYKTEQRMFIWAVQYPWQIIFRY